MLGSASVLGIDQLKHIHPEKHEMYVRDMMVTICGYCGRFYDGKATECDDGCGAVLPKFSIEVPFGMNSKAYIGRNVSEVDENGYFCGKR